MACLEGGRSLKVLALMLVHVAQCPPLVDQWPTRAVSLVTFARPLEALVSQRLLYLAVPLVHQKCPLQKSVR
jgi:hypothetical protein